MLLRFEQKTHKSFNGAITHGNFFFILIFFFLKKI
jgi:hypothetical protein